MAEEQKWQEAVTNHVLCANKCGYFGSPTTLNLCSKCYKDHCFKERHISTAKIAVEQSLIYQSETDLALPSTAVTPLSRYESESSSSAAVSVSHQPDRSIFDPEVTDLVVTDAAVTLPATQQRNRCGSCRKRVGLTGFTCRCGTTFCGTHRYPEKHDCSFDFKAMGKEAIARENPVVKAAKLDKI